MFNVLNERASARRSSARRFLSASLSLAVLLLCRLKFLTVTQSLRSQYLHRELDVFRKQKKSQPAVSKVLSRAIVNERQPAIDHSVCDHSQ